MSTIRADNIGPSDGGTSTDLLNGISKHSINFDATTNVVNNSYNNSSLTDNGTGDFTFNFTNNFATTHYREIGSTAPNGPTSALWTLTQKPGTGYNLVSSLRIEITYVASTTNRTLYDLTFNNSDIFGDLA